MEVNGLSQQADAFWNFLAYLKEYVKMSKSLLHSNKGDSSRTRLLSALAENMRPFLRADISFVGYRDIGEEPAVWLNIVPETVEPWNEFSQSSPLIKHLKLMEWCFLYQELEQNWNGTAYVFLDQELERFPIVFRGAITALAISRLTLQEREYFLFFCDINDHTGEGTRYTDFDKATLDVATGLLGAGFESGVRGGKRAERNEFLSDLIQDFDTSIQTLLMNLSSVLSKLHPQYATLRQMVLQSTSSARHLALLVDTIKLSSSENELSNEPLVITEITNLLQDAVDMFDLETQEHGIVIQPPKAYDGQNFPALPVYPTQLTIAFKNILHYAIVYSQNEKGAYFPIQISGCYIANKYYAVDFLSFGPEIVKEGDEQDFNLSVREHSIAEKEPTNYSLGLGLTFVKRIVDNHNGSLNVDSAPTLPGLFQNRVRILLPLEGPTRKTYDVFLLCDKTDVEAVKVLANRLRQAGMNPWFAVWNLVPGDPRQETVEKALANYNIIIVFWGSKGLTGWENEDMRVAIESCIDNRDRKIIPVALPEVEISDQDIPPTLRRRIWVRFLHLDDLDAFRALVGGIRGEPPGPGPEPQ